MTKKVILVLVFVGLVAGGVFAQAQFRLSAGQGVYFTSDFGGGVKAPGDTMFVKTPYAGGGGFIFLDATFAELSLGPWFGASLWKMTPPDKLTGKTEFNMFYTGLDIGLLGKYPVIINNQLSIFPLLGINYRLVLALEDEDTKYADPIDHSALWFRLGGGLDYSFTNIIYLRAGVLYGLRLANKYENNMLDNYPGMDTKTLPGHGLEVKLAVGFRFYP